MSFSSYEGNEKRKIPKKYRSQATRPLHRRISGCHRCKLNSRPGFRGQELIESPPAAAQLRDSNQDPAPPGRAAAFSAIPA